MRATEAWVSGIAATHRQAATGAGSGRLGIHVRPDLRAEWPLLQRGRQPQDHTAVRWEHDLRPADRALLPPRLSNGHQHRSRKSYGNPFTEDDSVAFADGTGQFDGLSGAASFHTFSAGPPFRGTLKGILSG
jgi:hypothetical protein